MDNCNKAVNANAETAKDNSGYGIQLAKIKRMLFSSVIP